MRYMFRLFAALLLASMFSFAAHDDVRADVDRELDYAEFNDPLERLNRSVFEFNRAVDDGVLKPVARTYRTAVPQWFRDRVGASIDNLRSPVIFVNDLLQGEIDRALTTLVRFGINSTFGLGGLNDLASDLGLEQHGEDFGQTFAVWGIGEGPYIMLPILGPSNPRDAVGRVVEYFVDPFNSWARNTDREAYVWARTVSEGVHLRTELLDASDELEKTSLDLYAAVRSLYRQRRANEIRNGVVVPSVGPTAADFPDWSSDFEDEEVSRTP